MLHHQGSGGAGGAERRGRRPHHADSPVRPDQHGHDQGAGPVEQPVFRQPGTRSWDSSGSATTPSLFGLGEKAGLDIAGEQPGILPDASQERHGHDDQLRRRDYADAARTRRADGRRRQRRHTVLSAIPEERQQEARNAVPQVKRRLEIAELIPEIKPGMKGAVEYGTARRIGSDPRADLRQNRHLHATRARPRTWAGSDRSRRSGNSKLVVVVLLTGGSVVSGPAAAGVAGQVYKNLGLPGYFARSASSPVAVVTN